MKKKFIAALAFTLPMFIACNDDGETQQPDSNRVAITPTAGITTRAVDATWHNRDEIGIYTVKAGTKTIAGNVSNFRYTNSTEDGASANFNPYNTGNTAYYPQDGSKVDILAYYPYTDTSKNDMFIVVDVCNQTSLPAIDLMTADVVEGKSQDDPEASLRFAHRLTKVNITLEKGQGAEDVDLTNATVTISGTPGTASYNLFSQSFESFGKKKDIVLTLPTAIVTPTAAGSGVTFTVEAGGKTFNAALPNDVALGSGEEATITITLKIESSSEMASVSATIRPWTGGPTAGLHAIAFVIPENPETGIPEVETFNLWKNDDEDAAAIYTYNAVEKTWSATPIQFYLDDITATDRFSARHTPIDADADPITGVKDILEAGPVGLADKKIALEFRHVNAQVIINLAAGSGLPAGTDLSTAQISFGGKSFTGASHTLVVEPGTVKPGDITVAVDGMTFTASGNDIAIATGTTNTLTLTLRVEQTGKPSVGLEVKMKEWLTGVEEDLTAVHFKIAENPQTGEPEVSAFTLYKNKGKLNEDRVEYSYAGGIWSALPAPFYVEDITGTDTFTGEVIPTTADRVTGVKDILTTDATSMDNEGIIDLAFRHLNARLTVNLYSGTGVPEGNDLSKAAVKIGNYNLTGAVNTVIVEPMSLPAADIQITVDGKTYGVSGNNIEIATGTTNTLTLTLTEQQSGKTAAGLEVKGATWATGTDIPLTAVHFTVPKNPETGEPEVTTFHLTKKPSTGNEISVMYTYNTATKEWETSSAPFYVEDIKPTDIFHARHDSSSPDPVTGVADDLVTDEVSMNTSNIIPLNFKHTVAQLEFILEREAGLVAPLDGAVIAIQGQDWELKADTEYLLTLMTFTNHPITVTLNNGMVYTGIIADSELVAGQKTVITVTLKVTEAAGISVGVADWGEDIEKSTDVKLPIDMNANDLSALADNPGTIKIISGSQAGTYSWDGAELSATTPLYWDNLASGTVHSFAFTFTPDEDGAPAKKILQATATGIQWGEDIAFGNLLYINSKFEVNLIKGTTYSDSDWAAATKTLKLYGFSTPEYTMSDNTAIVEPVVLTDAHKVELTIGGHTYTIALKSIFTEFEEKKTYTLNATVNKTGIGGIEIGSVTDWIPGGTGTGEFEY